MSSKRKHPTTLPTAADYSRIGRKNSQNSPWRKTPISHRSALCYDPKSKRQRQCAERFAELEEQGDTRRVPRPELD